MPRPDVHQVMEHLDITSLIVMATSKRAAAGIISPRVGVAVRGWSRASVGAGTAVESLGFNYPS